MPYLRRKPKPDRRRSLRELEQLFDGLSKRKAASWQGNAAFQNDINGAMCHRHDLRGHDWFLHTGFPRIYFSARQGTQRPNQGHHHPPGSLGLAPGLAGVMADPYRRAARCMT